MLDAEIWRHVSGNLSGFVVLSRYHAVMGVGGGHTPAGIYKFGHLMVPDFGAVPSSNANTHHRPMAARLDLRDPRGPVTLPTTPRTTDAIRPLPGAASSNICQVGTSASAVEAGVHAARPGPAATSAGSGAGPGRAGRGDTDGLAGH